MSELSNFTELGPFLAGGSVDGKPYTAVWYAEVNATSGTVSPPTGGTLIADRFASGVDALCSTITTTLTPDLEAPVEADTTPVVVSSFNTGTGAFTLSGTPSSFPVAVIFAYDVAFIDFDSTKDLVAVDLDESGGGGGGGAWSVAASYTGTGVESSVVFSGLTGINFYKLYIFGGEYVTAGSNVLILFNGDADTTGYNSDRSLNGGSLGNAVAGLIANPLTGDFNSLVEVGITSDGNAAHASSETAGQTAANGARIEIITTQKAGDYSTLTQIEIQITPGFLSTGAKVVLMQGSE